MPKQSMSSNGYRGNPRPPARQFKSPQKKPTKKPTPRPNRRQPRPKSRPRSSTSSKRSRSSGIGATIGGFLGNAAETGIRTIFGMGEYTEALGNELGVPSESISSNEAPDVNSLVRPVNSSVVRHMHTNTEGCVRVTRREFVQPILIQDDATIFELSIEPSKAVTFPWLSGIAESWQQYQLLGVAAEYVPTSGAAVSNDSGALGQVVMAFKYDVTEAYNSYPNNSLRGMLNQSGAVSTSPAAPATCFMECDPEMSNQFTRFIRRPASGVSYYSEQNFDAAKLMVLTQGAQNSTDKQAGQLWITYDILLFHPTTIGPAPLSTKVLSDPIYTKFQALWEKLYELTVHSGPYTQDEFIARESMMQVLRSKLTTPELVQQQALWRVITDATSLADEPGQMDYPLLDYIHSSPLYQMAAQINPPDQRRPLDPRSPGLDRWETVSNR